MSPITIQGNHRQHEHHLIPEPRIEFFNVGMHLNNLHTSFVKSKRHRSLCVCAFREHNSEDRMRRSLIRLVWILTNLQNMPPCDAYILQHKITQ